MILTVVLMVCGLSYTCCTLPVIKKNSLINVNSFLVMTSQVMDRGKA